MREMKDSGVEWIGCLPKDWVLNKGKYIFVQRNDRGNDICLQLLSPTQKYGVIPQDKYEELSGMKAVKLNEKVNLAELKTVHAGAYCISLRSFQGGFEYSNYEGVVSPAYQIFYPKGKINDDYYKYLFKTEGFIQEMNSFTMSLRDGKNIAFEDFGNSLLPVPPLSEQNIIASFLDAKCAEIDALSADIQKEIETLKEYRKSVITEAVTKGLDPNVEMKDSGIEWIGEIPVSWLIKRLKYTCDILDDCRSPIEASKRNQDAEVLYDYYGASGAIDKIDGYTIDDHVMLIGEDGANLRMRNLPLMYEVNGKAWINNHAHILKPKAENDFYFIFYALESTDINNYITGSAQPKLNQEKLKQIPIPICEGEIQRIISVFMKTKCSEIDSIIADKQKQIETLAEYRKSLIYEYVTGKKEVPTA